MRRLPLLTMLALVLAGGTLPAHAAPTAPAHAAPAPLRLTGYTVTTFPDFISVNASFSGLEGRQRPGPDDYKFVLDAGGTVKVSRTYGCQAADGKRLRQFDRKVKVTHNLIFRMPGRPIPDGDTLEWYVYAQPMDAQPGNCPDGTEPMLYALQAKHVRFELKSTWASIPSATYALPGCTSWSGAVPTSALAN